MKKLTNRQKVLKEPSYWIESINGYMYDAIVRYMELHKMKQKDLAKHLGITPGRVSQILNDGEMNFSLEKIIKISLKIDKYPVFEFQDKAVFEKEENKEEEIQNSIIFLINSDQYGCVDADKRDKSKVIPMNIHTETEQEIRLQM